MLCSEMVCGGSNGPCLAHVCLWPCYLVAYISLSQDSEGRYSG